MQNQIDSKLLRLRDDLYSKLYAISAVPSTLAQFFDVYRLAAIFWRKVIRSFVSFCIF